MSWSYIGGTVDTDGGITAAKAVTAGNLIIVTLVEGTSGHSPGISGGGITWTRIGSALSDVTNSNTLTWWWGVAVSTATLTVTMSGTTSTDWIGIAEYNTSLGTVPSDSLVTQSSHSSFTNDSGSVATDGDTSNAATPGVDGCLLVGFIADTQAFGDGSTFFAAGTSFTKRAASSSDPISGGQVWAIEDRVQTTSASAAATWTAINTNAHAAFVAFFKETGSGAGPDAPSVSDATTVTEAQTLNVKDMPNVFNSVTMDELIQMMMPVYASLNDAVTVMDASSVSGLSIPAGPAPNVNDSVTVTESVGASLLTDGVFRQAAIAHTTQVTPSMAVRARNTLIAFIRWTLSTTVPNLLTVSDTNGNTWTLIQNPIELGSGVRIAAAVCINTVNGDTTPTIFANFDTPPADVWIAMHEVATRDLVDPVEGADWNTQGGPVGVDSITTGAVTTLRDGAYIFAAATESGSGVVTHPGTGFLMRTRDVPVSVGLITEDKIQTSAGTTSGTFSPDPAGAGYASIVVALRFARLWQPTVSDAVTVTDVVGLTVSVALSPIVFDAVTVTESVTMLEKPIQLPVSDSVTVSELSQGNIASFPGLAINVFDTVIMEGSSAPFINVSDTVSVTELVLISARGVQASDNVTISESVTVRLRIFITVHDDAMLIIMAEGGEYVTVTESVTLTFATFGARAINVNDAVAVTEFFRPQYNPLQAVTFDATVVTDQPSSALVTSIKITVSDAVTTTDIGTAVERPIPSVSDAVTVSDNVLLIRSSATLLAMAVADDTTVTDTATIFGAPNITVSDAVTVSEATVQAVVQLKLSVNDAVTIADAVSLSFPTVGALNLSETVTVTESVSLRLSLIRLSVFDDVNVGEGRDVAANPLLLSVGDNVSIEDEPFAFAGERSPSPRIRGMFAWEHWIRREP